MNNNISSQPNFQANLCLKHLGSHNIKMKNVAKNFNNLTSKYPYDCLNIDKFGFYSNKINLEVNIPLTQDGMKILFKSSEDEITKASVKLFKILKKVVNKSTRVFRSTAYLSDNKNTTMSENDIINMENLISKAVGSAQMTEIINKTKKDKILKHIDYNSIEISPWI